MNEDAHARSFAPGPMFHATEIATWFDDNDAPESISMLELRNACGLDLDYAFGPDSQAHNAAPRRVLDSHSIQTQQVPTGYWLHLWHAGRWLAAATTLAETGLIELSADCERLEVHVETDAGPASFAIHWELDVATGVLPTAQVPDTIELSLDLEPTPEQWGTELAEPSERVQLRLLNLCAEAATYAFTPEASSEPGHSSTLAAHSERFVEVPAQWWLQYQLLDEGWRGGATTNHSGSSLWIAPNCIDYGIGDGDVIGRF